jgi:hypothetical protein
MRVENLERYPQLKEQLEKSLIHSLQNPNSINL